MPPNILVILADDMRYEQTAYMPNLRTVVQTKGTTFTAARCNYALCQPNRTGFITGQLSKIHGVTGNGSMGTVNEDNTLAKWVHDVGYRTGLIGKYMNSSDVAGRQPAPVGWDTWREVVGITGPGDEGQNSYAFRANDGTTVSTVAANYHQLDWIKDNSLTFIAGSEPWFLYMTPTAGHVPFEPYPADLFKFGQLQYPIIQEYDVTDKPSWVQAAAAPTEDKAAQFRENYRQQCREMFSLDKMLLSVFNALPNPNNTVIIFASDNGLYMGEHRNPAVGIAKVDPYDVNLRVPLLFSGPGFNTGKTLDQPVYALQDVTATIVALTAANPGIGFQAGADLKGLIANPTGWDSRYLLHQRGGGSGNFVLSSIACDCVTTKTNKLMRWQTTDPDKYELYDLVNDPNELQNQAYAGGSWLTLRNQLEAYLNMLLA
jgi:N-acetylglucosamine-6-sulfatase